MIRIADGFSAFVLLAGYGGLRLGELAGLRKAKIDPQRRTVRVDTSLIEVRGKLIDGRPKKAAGIRTVPVPRSVAERLRASVSHLSAQDHVFTGAEGSPIRAGSFRCRFWTPALVRADLNGLQMHDQRHTAVSTWIAHGATAKQVQGLGRALIGCDGVRPLRPSLPRWRGPGHGLDRCRCRVPRRPSVRKLAGRTRVGPDDQAPGRAIERCSKTRARSARRSPTTAACHEAPRQRIPCNTKDLRWWA